MATHMYVQPPGTDAAALAGPLGVSHVAMPGAPLDDDLQHAMASGGQMLPALVMPTGMTMAAAGHHQPLYEVGCMDSCGSAALLKMPELWDYLQQCGREAGNPMRVKYLESLPLDILQKMAIELKRRSAWLSHEEATEYQRCKRLRVLGCTDTGAASADGGAGASSDPYGGSDARPGSAENQHPNASMGAASERPQQQQQQQACGPPFPLQPIPPNHLHLLQQHQQQLMLNSQRALLLKPQPGAAGAAPGSPAMRAAAGGVLPGVELGAGISLHGGMAGLAGLGRLGMSAEQMPRAASFEFPTLGLASPSGGLIGSPAPALLKDSDLHELLLSPGTHAFLAGSAFLAGPSVSQLPQQQAGGGQGGGGSRCASRGGGSGRPRRRGAGGGATRTLQLDPLDSEPPAAGGPAAHGSAMQLPFSP